MEASDRGLFLVEVESKKWKQITSSPSPSALREAPQWERGLNAQQPAWSPDSKFLAFSAESGEWFDIGLFGVETGKVTWITHGTGDDTSPCWSRDGRQVGWLHADGAANSLCIQERGGEIKQYKLSTGIHHHPQFTPQDEILFVFESPKQPPDLWKLNPGGTFEQLTNSLPDDFRSAEFVIPEEVSYEYEGVCVPALLYHGRGDRAVLNIHGGPNWHVQFLWDPLATHMVSRGWTVLAPNYRGSTGYGRAWQIASRFDMGGVDTRDCSAGAEYLRREALVDQIAVTGRSHGGYLTMTCLTQYPQLWCGGSAVVPFLNWFQSHADSREDLQHWNIENMGGPEEYHDRWYNASPYFFLDRVDSPVQLICGAHDPRCPAGESLHARDKLTELGKEVELLLYEDEGHSFLKIENVIDAEVKRVEFLAKVLETKKP
jgi:dipeptidyl aminopeptidase/acylaminoacyl peptidase